MFILKQCFGIISIVLSLFGINLTISFAQAQSSAQIELVGTIMPNCSTTGTRFNFDLNKIAEAGSNDFRFPVDCNAPFEYRLSSQNGGFKLENTPNIPKSFSGIVPYEIAVHVPLTPQGSINTNCSSANIKALRPCASATSGSSVAIAQTGIASINWSKSTSPLLPGTYSDVLTISISVSP